MFACIFCFISSMLVYLDLVVFVFKFVYVYWIFYNYVIEVNIMEIDGIWV